MTLAAPYELQKAIRAHLVASPAVVAKVPAASIVDDVVPLDTMPCVVLGESQIVNDEHDYWIVYLTIHVWAAGSHTGAANEIAAVVEDAISTSTLTVEGFRCSYVRVNGGRTLRDPDDKHVHSVLDIEARVQRIR